MSLVIPKDFAYVIITSTLTALEVIIIGFFAGSLRGKKPFDVMKYPDTGNGRYSQKLEEKDWVTFNNYQRAHMNFVEGVASAITFQLLSGLFFPKLAGILGAMYIAGRALYAYGYMAKGPKGRSMGGLILDVALVAMFVASLAGAVNLLCDNKLF